MFLIVPCVFLGIFALKSLKRFFVKVGLATKEASHKNWLFVCKDKYFNLQVVHDQSCCVGL